MKYCYSCKKKLPNDCFQCPGCGSDELCFECDDCGDRYDNGFNCPTCYATNYPNSDYDTPYDCPKCGLRITGRICAHCGNDMAAIKIDDPTVRLKIVELCDSVRHHYLDCKCIYCGDTRDDFHKFIPTGKPCEFKCTICGTVELMNHKYKDNICEICGRPKYTKAEIIKIVVIAGVIIGLFALAIAVFLTL